MISVVVLVAYDWRLAAEAIVRAWTLADEILLACDRRRLSYTGRPFQLPLAELLEYVRRRIEWSRSSTLEKLRIVEADFYVPGRSPIELETQSRNACDHLCAAGNWLLHIDADEWIRNPLELRTWIHGHPKQEGLMRLEWITVWKVIGQTALVVDHRRLQPLGTRLRGMRVKARMTREQTIDAPGQLVHWSIGGRSREEIETKLHNWTHAGERDAGAFLRLWDSVTLENFEGARNVAPYGDGSTWPRLRAMPVDELLGGGDHATTAAR